MKKLKIIFVINCICLICCTTDEPSTTPQEGNQQYLEDTKDSNPSDTSEDDDKYYFDLGFPASREIKPEAGTTEIFFKSNQEYTISSTGNITGLKLSKSQGEGSGSVIVSFDAVQYDDDERDSNKRWNEYGYIIFTVKEGSQRKYEVVRKEFHLFRHGALAKI